MTIEEAIMFAHYAPQLSKEPEVREFYRMCEKALRTQQTPAKLDRSRWKGCVNCTTTRSKQARKNLGYQYCEHCGRPLTDEAWAELERRIGGNDGTADS